MNSKKAKIGRSYNRRNIGRSYNRKKIGRIINDGWMFFVQFRADAAPTQAVGLLALKRAVFIV